jgi:tRNA (guanine-N7-)-methyltransferase
MRRRIRHHVNPFSYRHLGIPLVTPEIDPSRTLEVELGCAEGDYLFARSAVAPDRFLLGVEIRSDLVDLVNRRAAQCSGSLVKAVYANLLTDLDALFPPRSVTIFHVNFPDPCFKRSQHKRRFFTPELAESLYRALVPGGIVSFQSDIFPLALEAMEILESLDPRVRNALSPWSFCRINPFGAVSRREQWHEAAGTRIWRLRYQKS